MIQIDMDMPKECADCNFSCPRNGYDFYCCVDLKDVDLSNPRKDCPLKEVPMECEAEDCISKVEVIDYLCKHCPDDGECFKDCDEIKYLRSLPSVYPKSDKPSGKWIPVTERLPKKDGCYLVTEKSGRVCTYVFHKEGNSEEYWARCTVAWMPLPKAYGEVEE